MSIETKRFESADEAREFLKGRFEVAQLRGITIGRAAYEPGWKWSEHVGRELGQSYCEVEHVGLVLAGRAAVQMKGGGDFRVLEPGDLFCPLPGRRELRQVEANGYRPCSFMQRGPARADMLS